MIDTKKTEGTLENEADRLAGPFDLPSQQDVEARRFWQGRTDWSDYRSSGND
jgi:hypothetical protein